MKLKLLEKSDEKMKIEMEGESFTLANLLRKNLWESGAEQASYMKEHPYLSQPKIIVFSKNPKKSLENAAQKVADAAKEFQTEFKRALKK